MPKSYKTGQLVCSGDSRTPRSGVAAVEAAIVLPVLVLVLFALLDLGLAALRYNTLAEVARRVGRAAIYRGSQASDLQETWGPTAYTGNASDGSPYAASIQDLLPTMVGSEVSLSLTWLDADNSPSDRVSVAVAYQHQPLLPVIFAWGPLDLQASTTMRIVN